MYYHTVRYIANRTVTVLCILRALSWVILFLVWSETGGAGGGGGLGSTAHQQLTPNVIKKRFCRRDVMSGVRKYDVPEIGTKLSEVSLPAAALG